MKGTIKAVKLDRGFGFIASQGRDVFFHVGELSHELPFDETLLYRDVIFDMQPNEARPRAVMVRPAY